MDEMATQEYALEWLTYAEADLNSAEFLLNLRPLPIEIICYHCQQSAEKCLKGLLVTQAINPPKIHDLRELYDLCSPIIANISPLAASCEALNPYSSQPRYPHPTIKPPIPPVHGGRGKGERQCLSPNSMLYLGYG
jgi:HEPN domain-containing protein